MAKIIDGKKLSEKILDNLKKEIKKRRLKLTLAVVLVGDDLVSKVFVRQKGKACKTTDIDFKLFKFPAKISVSELKKEIERIIKDKKNSGVIIQLPLSRKFDSQKFLNFIPLEKDIDVLSEKSLDKFRAGKLSILPPVVGAVFHLLKEYKISLKGKNIVLVGAGKLVGFPLSIWFSRKRAKVSIVDEFTKNIPSFTKKADIIISGAGKPNLIKGNMVKRGVIIIDAGTVFRKGKLIGDVDFKEVCKKASYIAPVPGGLGPLTVASLLENLVKLSQRRTVLRKSSAENSSP